MTETKATNGWLGGDPRRVAALLALDRVGSAMWASAWLSSLGRSGDGGSAARPGGSAV